MDFNHEDNVHMLPNSLEEKREKKNIIVIEDTGGKF
jgi:hypothetical protein